MFDKLLEQPGCLCKINTPQPEKIFNRLDRYQDYTGKAFYNWTKGKGLYRTDIPNICAPNTANFINAIQHISLSIHFGIYLFTDVDKALHEPNVVNAIERIINNNHNQKKLLIFAGEKLDIPSQIDQHFTTVRHKLADEKSSALTHYQTAFAG